MNNYSQFELLSMLREELEQLALECIDAENYYELTDSIGELTNDELIDIILCQ